MPIGKHCINTKVLSSGLPGYRVIGLSGSGKSTLAHAVEENLQKACVSSYVLDGDNVRHGLSDLGHSDSDRVENIRRVGE